MGEILVRHGAITPEKLESVVERSRDSRESLSDRLVESGALDEETLVRALAQEAGLDVLTEIDADKVPPEIVDRVPMAFARQNGVLPISIHDDRVTVALSNPLDPSPLDDIRALLGREVAGVAVPPSVIADVIGRVYERKTEAALDEAHKDNEEEEELQDLTDMADEAPVIRWVNNLFSTALRDRASDIHIEPTDNAVSVRYRIDGRLIPRKSAHRGFLPSIVSRIKIEADLNIAEKRLPQDGRITKKIGGKLVDMRVSTVPTAKGERIVIRLLDKANVMLNLTDLGFDRRELATMEYLIQRPNGIVLVTGPTGSGKTTSLYACLNKINVPMRNILTVEDPVEYELPGIGQVHVRPKIGLTFASGLRSFLRQDPDVIMVGEIRDSETAEIAIHASLTGHLVMSTLHTNDAPTAVTRLVDMGIQPFQISSSVMAVLAQRLVRRLCRHCCNPYQPTSEDLLELGLNPRSARELWELKDSTPPPAPEPDLPGDLQDSLADEIPTEVNAQKSERRQRRSEPPMFYLPGGCEFCSGTGYRGRIGIYELMVVSEPIRREILNGSDSKTIMRVAVNQGMRTLREDGARKVLAGLTSVDEVLAATQAGDPEVT